MLVTGLKNAKLDPTYPLTQGLRPARSKNVRVERELRRLESAESPSRIVHCYGHGGSGWSLSFGCAADVIDLLDEAMQGKKPEPMNYLTKELKWCRCVPYSSVAGEGFLLGILDIEASASSGIDRGHKGYHQHQTRDAD
ncbi:hypothetical protein FB45DRAFT_875391 [Roridomyces roridus]|uniref:FAD dependent oxidoreductase domain-containing protein n=1 Tax=Roridomyces roridus TaxID=1738132 RepID=A0AAD7B6G5_9AGAR|nr:hypothetical protein FB45DRAFT_875391 [Roridomyces roridus]